MKPHRPPEQAPLRDVLTSARRFLVRFAQAVAVAATLAVGVGLGWAIRGNEGRAPSRSDLPALAQVVSVLPTGETREIAGVGQARVLGSFQTARGLCRLILTESTLVSGVRFVVCREDADWQVVINVAQTDQSGFASAAATEAIDMYLDAIGAGPALSAEAGAAQLE